MSIVKEISKPLHFKVADLNCIYCLHYQGKKKPCPLPRCCCEEERAEAIRREQAKASQRILTKN